MSSTRPEFVRVLVVACLIGVGAWWLLRGSVRDNRREEDSAAEERGGVRVASAEVPIPPGEAPVPVPPIEQPEGYAPEVKHETDGGVFYTFAPKQAEHMLATPLDRDVLIEYLETRWSLPMLHAWCTPRRRFPDHFQNLVPDRLLFDTFDLAMHDDQPHKFDKIFVYVGEEDWRHTRYFGDAGVHWYRWSYSLNVLRGDDHWAIIEYLPNDLMDRPEKYLPSLGAKRR
ncbi:MAG: hypothetical protein JSS27_02160 [Planctomycetes bacterium]|nr:hypothetical protein [Planctomycetota bacterium]